MTGMAEYIEREKLISDIDAAMENEGMGYVIGQTMKRYIKRVPAADVAPVRHGRWEKAQDMRRMDGNIYDFRCSRCNAFAEKGLYNNYDRLTNYCPNCGAKMDEEGIFVGICEHCAYREDCEWPKLHPKIKLKECPDFNKGDKK